MNILEDTQWQDEIIFWLLFFLFNFSAFSFLTLINFKPKHLVPFQSISRYDTKALFLSFNPDCYRICVDLSLIILSYRWLSIDQGYAIASIYYGMLLVYSIYHYSFSKIYQVYPIISNDYRLIINAFGILWGESKFKTLLYTILAVLCIVGLLFGFHQTLVFSSTLPTTTFFFIFTLPIGLYVVFGLHKYGIYRPKGDSAMRILITPLRIAFNLIHSWRLINRLKSTSFEKLDKNRNLQLNLAQKPNIYCLLIESYGSVLLKEEKLKQRFTEDFNHFKNALSLANWKTTTNLSQSVSPVGPSWLAYTSVIFGNKVANNFEYEFLLNNEALYPYDTLMKVFMKEGYTSYHLNPTQPKAGVMVPYQQMTSFFGIDHWILAKDIDYTGTVYGFTESPSDQFVLNHAYEKIKTTSGENPFVLFYLTKNSHTPYFSPDRVAPDWKALNNGENEKIGNEFLREPTFSDYQKAITYQLNFIEDFIVNQAGKNDIFLLIGDHQPHVLGNHEKYGQDTLVHVISQNQDFIDGFKAYGFKDSIHELDSKVRHEAIYSLFVREVIKSYGEKGAKVPPYEPDGIIFR